MDENIVASFKILLIGDTGVGKSSILLRFVDNKWSETMQPTLGVDYKIKLFTIENENYKLKLWDTAGQERFRSLTSSYYRNTQGVVLVFDVTNKQSLLNLESWRKEVEYYNSGVVTMIIANKIDQPERQVSREEGEMMAYNFGALYIETSAKTNQGIIDSFKELTEKIVERPSLWKNDNDWRRLTKQMSTNNLKSNKTAMPSLDRYNDSVNLKYGTEFSQESKSNNCSC
ncbi:Ras- protein Rab-18 [Lobulomyces angularis]|nr:Ras- protein Rab-18 [Lobulomyces angularis]